VAGGSQLTVMVTGPLLLAEFEGLLLEHAAAASPRAATAVRPTILRRPARR
jgi:hypothetical protein